MDGELKDTPCEEEDSHEFLYLDIKDEIVFAPKAHSKFSGKQYLRLKLKQVFTLHLQIITAWISTPVQVQSG